MSDETEAEIRQSGGYAVRKLSGMIADIESIETPTELMKIDGAFGKYVNAVCYVSDCIRQRKQLLVVLKALREAALADAVGAPAEPAE